MRLCKSTYSDFRFSFLSLSSRNPVARRWRTAVRDPLLRLWPQRGGTQRLFARSGRFCGVRDLLLVSAPRNPTSPSLAQPPLRLLWTTKQNPLLEAAFQSDRLLRRRPSLAHPATLSSRTPTTAFALPLACHPELRSPAFGDRGEGGNYLPGWLPRASPCPSSNRRPKPRLFSFFISQDNGRSAALA